MASDSAHKTGSSYHHGDLQHALVIAAAELIEEEGLMAFSLAAAARRLGVSTAAPYRHFRDRNELLDAVTDLAYFALNCEIERTAARHPPGTEECLVALGLTYLDFLQRHQPFYELMWGSRGAEVTSAENFGQRIRGLRFFIDALADWCRLRGIDHHPPEDIALAFWSMAHGLSLLQNQRAFNEFKHATSIGDMLRSNARIYLQGIVAEAAERRAARP